MNSRAALIAQAARGPILLITLGVVFALAQAGVLSFRTSWPLLLIVLGLMKLVEWLALPAVPRVPPSGMPPGGYTR